MIQIERVSVLPDWEWAEHTKREMTEDAMDIITDSDFVYAVGNCAVVGLKYDNYLCPPSFWFVLAKTITPRELFAFRQIQHLIPRGTVTGVDISNEENVRFAKVFGFEELNLFGTRAGIEYQVYRRK